MRDIVDCVVAVAAGVFGIVCPHFRSERDHGVVEVAAEDAGAAS